MNDFPDVGFGVEWNVFLACARFPWQSPLGKQHSSGLPQPPRAPQLYCSPAPQLRRDGLRREAILAVAFRDRVPRVRAGDEGTRGTRSRGIWSPSDGDPTRHVHNSSPVVSQVKLRTGHSFTIAVELCITAATLALVTRSSRTSTCASRW